MVPRLPPPPERGMMLQPQLAAAAAREEIVAAAADSSRGDDQQQLMLRMMPRLQLLPEGGMMLQPQQARGCGSNKGGEEEGWKRREGRGQGGGRTRRTGERERRKGCVRRCSRGTSMASAGASRA